MKLSNFTYELPKELLAEYPSDQRDESRLMVLHRDTQKIEHKQFKDIIDYFNDGDSCEANNDECSWEYGCIQWGWWYDWCYTYGYECEGGGFVLDTSYCEETDTDTIQGDLNGDTTLNILDVIILVDIILNGESSDLADINNDGMINILDVIELIDIIINQ